MKKQIPHEAIFEISKKSRELTDKQLVKKATNILLKQEPKADIYGCLISSKFVRILWYSNN
jgi:hypothetical protein